MEVAQAAEMPNGKGLVDDGLVCRIVSKHGNGLTGFLKSPSPLQPVMGVADRASCQYEERD